MQNSDTQQNELAELQHRLMVFKVGVLFLLILLVFRMWQLQVRDGPYYHTLSQDNRTRSVRIEPPRGLIYDRNGMLLANSVPSFNLYVSLEDVKDRAVLIERLTGLLGLDQQDLLERLSARESFARVKVLSGLTLREAALIESQRLNLAGVAVQAEYQRNYPVKASAAHLIGYIGEISEDQLAMEKFQYLHQGSLVGQYGIERQYDLLLRGASGRKLVEVDALGHEKRTLSVEKPQAGHDLYLSIDFRLQELADKLLGEEAGTIVALDPTNGEVLALSSQPSFDPNAISSGLNPKQWREILNDPRHPLNNRALQGTYPPGSTFKIVMAAAALQSRAVGPSEQVRCAGSFPFGRRVFRDWKRGGHGSVDLSRALIHSCDVYFYTVGNRMGIETIASFAEQFGLGQQTGIDLPSERKGIVPSPLWKQKVRGERWYPGETISVAIGQGYMTTTPLQMAQVVAAVANNGVAYRPRVVRGVRDRRTGEIDDQASIPSVHVSLEPEILLSIRKALEGVVTKGTARRAQSSFVKIAGKTGTAQVVALRSGPEESIPKEFRDHAWFVAYAPAEKPRIAVTVLVEHSGHGGSAAAPLAKELIETFVQLNQTPSGESPRAATGRSPNRVT